MNTDRTLKCTSPLKSQANPVSLDGSLSDGLTLPVLFQAGRRNLGGICSLTLLAGQVVVQSAGIPVGLSWDNPSDKDLAGITLHCGNASGNYTKHFPVGLVSSAIIKLDPGRWYIMATAENTSGLSSGPSNEVSTNLAPEPPYNFGFKGAQVLQENFPHKEPKVRYIDFSQSGVPAAALLASGSADLVGLTGPLTQTFSTRLISSGKGGGVLSSLVLPPAGKKSILLAVK